MAVKLAPNQLIKRWRLPRRPARRGVPSAADAGTGAATAPGGEQGDRRLVPSTAGKSRCPHNPPPVADKTCAAAPAPFFIRGKQQPIERRLRIVELRRRRRPAGGCLARLWRGHARRQPFPQPANKRILKRSEDFIHFAAAGQYAAGRQQDAVVKSRQITSLKVFSTAASRWRSLNSY